MFQLALSSVKLVAEQVQHLTVSRVFQLALSSSKLVAELDVQHLAAEPMYAGRVRLSL
jgi:hypothetical protein